MRVFTAGTTRVVAVIGPFPAITVPATGCAPAARNVVHVPPGHHRSFPDVHVDAGVRALANVRYPTACGQELNLDVCLPYSGRVVGTARLAIVAFHGGSWTTGDKVARGWRTVCDWLAAAGYVTVSFSYRLAPALLGTLGSGSLSIGHGVAAVAEFSGPTDLTASGKSGRWFIPLEEGNLGCHRLTACPQAAASSPIDHVNRSDPPYFISHSTSELTPLGQGLSFARKLRASGVPVTLGIVAGHQHSIVTLDSAMCIRVLAFFAAHLRHPLFLGLTG